MDRSRPFDLRFTLGLAASAGTIAGLLGGCAGSQARTPTRTLPTLGNMAVVDEVEVEAPAIPMGDPATVRRILDEGLHRNQVMEHLTHFCTTFGPRLTGSSNLENAQRWAVGRLGDWGMSNPRLWEWGTIPVRFDRVASSANVVTVAANGSAAVDREMAHSTLAWTIGTDGPVRGRVVKMPQTLAELEAARANIAGSWMLIAPPSGARQGIRGVGGNMNTRYGARREARQVLARGESSPTQVPPPQGPGVSDQFPVTGRWVGTVQHPDLPDGSTPVAVSVARFRRTYVVTVEMTEMGADARGRDAEFNEDTSTLSFTWTTPVGDTRTTLTLDGDALAGTPEQNGGQATTDDPAAGAGWTLSRVDPSQSGELIDNEAYILEQVLAAGPAGFMSSSNDERVWTTSAGGWRDLDLDAMPRDIEVGISMPDYDYINSRLADGQEVNVEVNLDHRLVEGPIPVYNVIAEIPGTDLADEVVIISAHFDSWNGPGSMGTTDNGTGSAVMLEAARILRAVDARPRRTIRLVLWSGEEQGLLGSRAYVASLSEAERAKISVCFVDDGGTNYQGGLPAPDVMVPYLSAATAPINNLFYSETDGKYLNVNVHSSGNRIPPGGSSDHASFNAVGIPGFFWDEIGRANYGYGWHTQHDRLDLAIPEYLMQSSTNTAVTAYNLACAPTLLPRPEQEQASAGE
ncbi:MAG: M20/M25/M40 family metallo-hydrolase [Phycisphaeraceae bacterium]|nr:M20/M25/M40 family metallo-hydrolase [Phycisphaeraceae bacterium]